MDVRGYELSAFMIVALVDLVCRAGHVCEDFACNLLAFRYEAPVDAIDCAVEHAVRHGWVDRRGSFLFSTPEASALHYRRTV